MLSIDVAEEADITKLAPTSSTTATLVMGDALLVAIETAKEFDRESFACTILAAPLEKFCFKTLKFNAH